VSADTGTSPSSNVFVNCPFDDAYLPMLDALLFCILACGFRPHCALEIDDSGQHRLDKILAIIAECPLGIHDISRIELDLNSGLPRFNTPFELGLYIAASRFGSRAKIPKRCLVLDAKPHRYQVFLSDITGQDIKHHDADPRLLIRRVRDWLRSAAAAPPLPGATALLSEFDAFLIDRPHMLRALRLTSHDPVYLDRVNVIGTWLKHRLQDQ
jgi:hypothetical protein